MKFTRLSLLALGASVLASGPADGDAVADPNSAVVKLTTLTFKDFVDANPLVLAEFYAPWCGYCKKLAPEYVKAADALNESHPNIKLAQIDCTEEDDLCRDFGVRGYPTLKVFRGSDNDDYSGPREAQGIIDYMVKESLPAVQTPTTAEELLAFIKEQTKPFAVQLLGSEDEELDLSYSSIATSLKKDLNFVSIKGQELIDALSTHYFEFDPTSYLEKISYFVVHPADNAIIPFAETFDAETLKDTFSAFVKTEIVPYFGDINRDTYLLYMESPLPIAYYFYKVQEQRDEVESFFTKLGKKFRGKINFVGLDANLFGRHAELLNMDPEIVPLFAIQDNSNGKKYGIDQKANPDGPTEDQIEEFVDSFFEGTAKPIIKSEPLPTDEEQAANPVYQLVTYNHDDFLKETAGKDVFVKYFADWCGHCKRLAPTWEELGELYKSAGNDVVIARIDHSKNDVETFFPIQGYPTLFLYPANGEVDEATGIRKPIAYDGAREFDAFTAFIQEKGGLGVDASEFKKTEEEEAPEKEVEHDEL